MAKERVQRRLAAILAADVVGYSRLMGQDESGTLTALKELRASLIDPTISEYQGRVVKLMGDGALVEFASVVDAVECAVSIQRKTSQHNADMAEGKRIEFRIGVNLGDIITDGDDIYGDGVNVAAWLEGIAEPGGVCVSDVVHQSVVDKLDLTFENRAEQTAKNIARPVRVYAVRFETGRAPTVPSRNDGQPPTDEPAIAVLPFDNMSGDPEQDFFAEGLSEDLITDLAKVPGLLVIARNSSFAYKGKPIDARQIAKELRVRYIVEGSVRRAEARLRINAQLIDAIDNSHLWADRFDRNLSDIFELQDEVVSKIVDALATTLPAGRPSVSRRATNLEAYDLFVHGRALVTQLAEDNRTARPLLERSIELDPNYAEAHAWLAVSHHFSWAYWGEPMEPHRSLSRVIAGRAVSLDPDNAVAHGILGDILIYDHKPEEGEAELATALRINPSHADALTFWGQLKAFEAEAEKGIDLIREALRLNPHPPGWYYWLLGLAQYAARRYDDAITTLRNDATHQMGSRRILAASLAQMGRIEEARAEAQQFLDANPHFSMEYWGATQPFRYEADRAHFIEGYLKAGLPKS